ncbi:MAG: hypothetical protein WCJ97_09685 [Phycisphaerae bacterium]
MKKTTITVQGMNVAKAKSDGLAPLIIEVRNLIQSARHAEFLLAVGGPGSNYPEAFWKISAVGVGPTAGWAIGAGRNCGKALTR